MPLWNRKETRAQTGPSFSIGDPALAEYLGMGGRNDAGVTVTESSALGLTAVWRSVGIISGTIAGLPLKTYRRTDGDQRVRVKSVLDNPGGDVLTPFEFKELALVHLLLHGNAYLLHIYNGGGALAALFPIHPSLVTVRRDASLQRIYTVAIEGGSKEYTSAELTHVMGMSTDGLVGLSPISVARNAIGTGLAGDKAAARMFSSGMLLGGLVSSDEHLDEEQAESLKTNLKAKLGGTNNAGDIAVVNASLKFTPWTMPAKDAQFIESRQYGVNEVARIFGVPKVLLAEDGASTWGSGIAELNRGLAKYTLMAWTSRFEERLSRLVAHSTTYCEFDYKGLLQPSPEDEIALLISQVDAGLLDADEARAFLNLAPRAAAKPEGEAA